MNENNFRILGRTGLKVGRLGVACSYGAPAQAFEEAFDRGVNYFYWGSMRKAAMAQAIRNIISNDQRGKLGGLASIKQDATWGSSHERHGLLPIRAFQSKRGCLHVRPQR